MNEDVGIWEKRLGVVGVRNANDAYFVQLMFIFAWLWRSVQHSNEEKKRRRSQTVGGYRLRNESIVGFDQGGTGPEKKKFALHRS